MANDNIYTQTTSNTVASACPVTGLGAAFHPFDDPYLADPYPFFEQARLGEPVFYSPEINHWVISRYDDIKRIFLDHETYSARNAQTPVTPWPPEAAAMLNAQGLRLMPNLSNNDPPGHTRVRAFVGDAFTPRRIQWIEPHVRRLITEAIDRMIGLGKADLVKELFYEIPARVLLVFLGIPDADVAKVKTWSEGRALLTWGRLTEAEIVAQIPSFIEYVRYCYQLVDHLEQHPGEDYTSELVQKLNAEHPEGLSKDNIAVALFGFLMAGHETTTNQSGNGFRVLLENRAAWQNLCADQTLIPQAIEEILRHQSSVISWRRYTTKEVVIQGQTIPKNSQLLLLLGAANYDDAVFAHGEQLDLQRKNARQHLSFGLGIHYCLGAPLARLELKIFLEEMTRRMPSLRLVKDQTYRYSRNTSHRGPLSLWAEWDVES